MDVVVITPPAPIVDLALAKSHLRVDYGEDDALIDAYVAAASSHIDGPGGWLGRAVGRQTLQARLDGLGPHDRHRGGTHRDHGHPWDFIPLPYPPLVSVDWVKYDDADVVEQTLDPATYALDPKGLLRRGPAAWPTAHWSPGSVRIQYVAGYDEPPPAIVAAVLLMVGDLFQNRETTDTGRVAQIPMSTTVERLLSPYRAWSV